MTLEDFFTLPEMKNGLATLTGVEELISVMQKQKGCALSNVSDTARQWSSVASTLAATGNENCFSYFVKLNGLCYLNQWLQEALAYSESVTAFAVEDLLNSLLSSLQKLPIHREDLLSSGIQSTVERLVGFKSPEMTEKLKDLSERWKHATENSPSYISVEGKCGVNTLTPSSDVDAVDVVNLTHPVYDKSTSGKGIDESNSGENLAGMGANGSSSHQSNVAERTEVSQMDKADDVLTLRPNQILANLGLNSDVADAKIDNMDALPSALASNFCQENPPETNDAAIIPAGVEMISSAACCCNAPGGADNDHRDALELKAESLKDTSIKVDVMEVSPSTSGDKLSKSGQSESYKALSSSGISVLSHAHKPEQSVSSNFAAKEMKPSTLGTVTMETLPNFVSIDCVLPKYSRNTDLKLDMQDLVSCGYKLRKNDDAPAFLSRKEKAECVNEVKVVGSKSKFNSSIEDSATPLVSSKPSEKKSTLVMGRKSELGLEYGEPDALEVARQVAIEVEREVVDYREPFCNSSPYDNSENNVVPLRSDDQKDQFVNEEQNGRIVSSPDNDLDASSPKDEDLRTADSDTNLNKCKRDVEIIRDSSDKTNHERCIFDLNEDVCFDESDSLINSSSSINVSAPIAIPASRGTSILPIKPVRFDGELGWKGSAATNAFCLASPQKTLDVENTVSGHKRKASLIGIDLNVAEIDDAIDPFSWEDSLEVSSKRVVRQKLDLNHSGQEDTPPFPLSCWSFPHQNGDQTMSPVPSSSSRQPMMKDFDLNDNPSFFDAMGSHNLSRFSSKESDMHDSTKNIMGSKITGTKDYLDGAPPSFMVNAPNEPANSMTSRTVMPHGHLSLSAYGYNGPVMGRPMLFPPPFYGHGSNVPHMVDSRGATAFPSILGSPGVNTPSAVLPFPISKLNTALGLNRAGTSQSALDLNSGFVSLETGSKDSEIFTKFFAQGQSSMIEGRVRTESHPSTAGAPMTQKATDLGWGHHPFGYKQESRR